MRTTLLGHSLRPGLQLGLQVASVAVFLLGWELAVRLTLVSSTLIPPPSSIVYAFQREYGGGFWSSNIIATLRHYLLGAGIGTIGGIALGYAAALSPALQAVQEGIARLFRPIPPLAWIPFAIIWFGISEAAATFIIAIGVFWVNYFSSYSGVRSIDRRLYTVSEVFGQGGIFPIVAKIIVPGSLPSVLAGIRSGLGIGWFAVLAAELFGIPGIGQRMMEASGMLVTDVVLLYMATIALLYTITDTAMSLLAARLLRWQA